ncbi:serine hydrolase domain-containing protein [Sporosarcina sp. G11-34]|uniref:serine hydrolase domain-containing protein n=1 Tax=Sporosarcina sp. G11-34 TaxID=2849605 RepID=UPI0022A90023|nr:serine hydrolase domain-containing protein [Sporosarcina sp. G11-34]MCZ2257735.1 beta-lactamase family protein [Sporosarcina sp. G11-34]
MDKWKQFEHYVEELMAKQQIPGVAIALSKNGETIYAKGFGTKDLQTKEPITPETIFGIASITKSFTALAIMKLVEEGKLEVDDAVSKHLPEFQTIQHEMVEGIKIHHLLSHTTGLATMERKNHLKNFTGHLDYLNAKKWSWLGVPGEYICYNNDMFLLLGAIIEKVTGESYQAYITKTIFTPLQMDRTSFDLLELQQLGNLTTPYMIEKEKPTACAWPTLGNYAVGGGIRSTVMDLLKYGQMYVNDDLQYKETLAQMTNTVIRTHGNSFYGYALQTTPNYEGFTLAEHGGSQPGVSSNFGFVREKELVAVVLTNLSGVSADEIWLAAVNTALDIPMEHKRNVEPEYDLSEEKFEPFVGTYTSDERSDVEISVANKKLVCTIDGVTHVLRASSERTLVITELEKPIRFFFDNTKKTWALLLGNRMLLKK